MTEKFGCVAAQLGTSPALRVPRRVQPAPHTRAARGGAATRNSTVAATVLRFGKPAKKVAAGLVAKICLWRTAPVRRESWGCAVWCFWTDGEAAKHPPTFKDGELELVKAAIRASLRPRSKYEHGYDLFEALLGRCRSRCAKRCRLGEFGPLPAALHVSAAQALPARSLVVSSAVMSSGDV